MLTGKEVFKLLTNTFCHLPGVGLLNEKKIWSEGVTSWNDFFSDPLTIPEKYRNKNLFNEVETSLFNLSIKNSLYFNTRLPKGQNWRMFPEFRHSIAYLDIETTGLSDIYNEITTISIYDGNSVYCFVNGENLDEFVSFINNYKLIVTYNGKCFDIPFIERYFKTKLNQAHIDLRYVLKNVGITGGLKGCEKKLGISRNELEGVDGYFAVILWKEYIRNKNIKALETLLAYNIEDVVNLEKLIIHAYNLSLVNTPFAGSLKIDQPHSTVNIPFKADEYLIDKIRRQLSYSSY